MRRRDVFLGKTRASSGTTPVPAWGAAFPWLRAGTTRRPATETDAGAARTDLGTAGEWAGRRIPAECVEALVDGVPWRSVVRSRQVHAAKVRVHDSATRGYVLAGDCDGHATQAAGVLLAVTLADCVPVFVVDPVGRAVALLHAGWRGVADGVVGSGIAVMADAFGSDPARLSVHAGPAICRRCYEVGPEVFAALGLGLPRHPRPAPLDLREVVRQRATAAGVPSANVTTSDECTLCGEGRYFSHRGGDHGRHLAFMGILPKAGPAAADQRRAPDPVGLCGRCAWSRKVETRQGSVFRLCLRHRQDPSFPKYPSLPVVRCGGFAVQQ